MKVLPGCLEEIQTLLVKKFSASLRSCIQHHQQTRSSLGGSGTPTSRSQVNIIENIMIDFILMFVCLFV